MGYMMVDYGLYADYTLTTGDASIVTMLNVLIILVFGAFVV